MVGSSGFVSLGFGLLWAAAGRAQSSLDEYSMKSNSYTALIFTLLFALQTTFVSAAPKARVTRTVDNGRRVRLTGHLHPHGASESDAGAVDSSEVLPAMTMTLRPSDEQEAALEKLLEEQQDPASPSYHQWLTPEQFGERFGVNEADLQKITSWLESQNLHVASVARARNAITFTGTAGDIGKAFQTEFRHYRSDTATHFANDQDPSIPVAFDGVIRSIHGLNNYRMKPHARLHKQSVDPNFTSTSGSHYLSPSDLQVAYGLKALHAEGYDGTGQTIVIAGQTQIDLSDIQTFRSQFQLPASDPTITLVPGSRDPGKLKDDMPEADLDIEWAGAAAPNATIQYVYANDVMDAVQYAIDQNIGKVISVSYGLCEPQTPRSDALTMQSWARQGNAMGITWVNASGDSGGADCVTSDSTRNAGLSVDIPAGIPEVTGIGGTSFSEGSGTYWNANNDSGGGSLLRYIPEATWNDSTDGDPAAGGGGASTYFSKPSWQTGAGVPADGARDVPDVSFNSSAEHDGYLVYTSGKRSVYGGTSAATPVFAGILTLLNQYLVATGAQSVAGLGNVNPRLYAMAQQTNLKVFNDITDGDNIVKVTCGTRSTRNCTAGSFGYSAGSGYDLATGLGSVDAHALVLAWPRQNSSLTLATAVITASLPSANVNGSGQVNISVSVAGQSGTAIPTGTATVSNGSTALGSATLQSGGSTATATVSVNPAQLATGVNTLTISYSGDGAYNPATTSISLTVNGSGSSSGTPSISSTGNGASFSTTYAPGMVLSIFGSNLASGTWAASTVPLATEVSGTTVTIAGFAAPFYYVSPTQLNVQIPYETFSGVTVPVIVTSGGRSVSSTIRLSSAAPGIFIDSSGGLVPAGTARRGQTISLYVTGAGAVSPSIATGSAPLSSTSAGSLPAPRQTTRVSIGGLDAPVQFVGIPAGLVGVVQVNVVVPQSASLGTNNVVVAIGGVPSNTAHLQVSAQ